MLNKVANAAFSTAVNHPVIARHDVLQLDD
jgi:hypothetical protein